MRSAGRATRLRPECPAVRTPACLRLRRRLAGQSGRPLGLPEPCDGLGARIKVHAAGPSAGWGDAAAAPTTSASAGTSTSASPAEDDRDFSRMFEELCRWRDQYGTCEVPRAVHDARPLAAWVRRCR